MSVIRFLHLYVNKDIKVALFGTSRVKEDIFDFLQSTYKLTSETAKPFVESNKQKIYKRATIQ